MYRHTASPVLLWPKVSGLRSGCPLSNLSVCFARGSPSRGASGEEARLSGMPRPPLGRGGGTASAVTERLSPAKASRSGCPLSNLSVCFADSSPSRGASGEEARLSGMPRPPLGRGGGTASAVTERLSPAKASRPGRPSSNLSVSLRSTAPLVGEPLARRQSFAECQSLPSLGEVARRQP